MESRDGVQKLSSGTFYIGNLGLQLLWHVLHMIVNMWYTVLAIANIVESYLISHGVLKNYKSLHLCKLQHLAIVIESDDAHETSKVVELLQWLGSIGVKNVCLYDMNGVLKKSKKAIMQQLKIVNFIEEANKAVTLYSPDHMTIQFASYTDGKEAVTKAANLLFSQNLKQNNLGATLDDLNLIESHLNEALQTVGSGGDEPDLLLVFGPVRCHLGFPAWRIRYTEIVHMGSLNSMRYGSLVKAIYNFTKVHQNYGT